MLRRVSKLGTGFLLCGLLHQAAASVLFTGAGVWDATASTTSVSAPGARWSFSFLLPNSVTVDPTSLMSAFTYALNGSAVGVAPAAIEFYNLPDSGMFDIDFRNGDVASFYGPTVWTSTSFLSGTYAVDSGIAGGVPFGSGTIGVRAIPEPAAWALLAMGLALVGSRRRTSGTRSPVA